MIVTIIFQFDFAQAAWLLLFALIKK